MELVGYNNKGAKLGRTSVLDVHIAVLIEKNISVM